MNFKHMPRRVMQYALGLAVMAIGVVLMIRVQFGSAPITSVPTAISGITPFTIGNMTILVHALCIIGQAIIVRRITLKCLLTALVGVPFGYIIDLFMFLFAPDYLSPILRIVLLFVGLACSGFGVRLVVGSDLMLPAPDELSHTSSQVYCKKLSNVKIVSDAIYVAIAASVDLLSSGKLSSVGIGTVLSVLFVGKFVGWFTKLFPALTMEPFWPGKRCPK